MADYTKVLSTLLDQATDRIVDAVAKEGLSALRSTLDSAGLNKYESLKGYDVLAHVSGGVVTFEIVVDFEAVDEETKKTMAPRPERDELIRKAVRTYALSGVGGATERIVAGSRDARIRSHDARKKIHDARRPAVSRAVDSVRGSEARLAAHEYALRAPRGMSVTKDGKLSVAIEKQVQKTARGVHFPQGDFQGILRDFMADLGDIVSRRFAPELEAIIARRFR